MARLRSKHNSTVKMPFKCKEKHGVFFSTRQGHPGARGRKLHVHRGCSLPQVTLSSMGLCLCVPVRVSFILSACSSVTVSNSFLIIVITSPNWLSNRLSRYDYLLLFVISGLINYSLLEVLLCSVLSNFAKYVYRQVLNAQCTYRIWSIRPSTAVSTSQQAANVARSQALFLAVSKTMARRDQSITSSRLSWKRIRRTRDLLNNYDYKLANV